MGENGDKELIVITIDVGQGDTNIIIFPNSKIYIIDLNLTNVKIKSFKNVFDKIREKYDIKEIEGVFITHKHLDHCRGFSKFLKENSWKINKVFINLNYSHYLDEIRLLYEYLEIHPEIKLYNANKNFEFYEGNTKISVFNPTLDNNTKENCGDINDSSISMTIEHGKCRFVFTGDIGKEYFKSNYNDGKSKYTFLKISHHGSATGTDEELLSNLSPDFSYIHAKNNNEHLPNKEVKKYLNDYKRRTGKEYFISGEAGGKVYRCDGKTIYCCECI